MLGPSVDYLAMQCDAGIHYIHDISRTIDILYKYNFIVIHFLAISLQQIIVHASCHGMCTNLLQSLQQNLDKNKSNSHQISM